MFIKYYFNIKTNGGLFYIHTLNSQITNELEIVQVLHDGLYIITGTEAL
jgi:hypothetical protein